MLEVASGPEMLNTGSVRWSSLFPLDGKSNSDEEDSSIGLIDQSFI